MNGLALKAARIAGTVAALICGAGCAFQRKLIFPADRLPQDHVFAYARPGEETRIRTEDGIDLDAMVFRRFRSRRIILYFHGNAGSLEEWGTVQRDLAFLGTDMIVFDYRGYGKSGGTQTEKGLYLDAEAVYGHARSLGYADSDIVVYGRSVGTGIAAHLAAIRPVSALVLESPYASLRGMIYREFWYMLPWFYLAYTFDTREKLAHADCPVLIVHGTRDEVIPFSEGRRLAGSRPHRTTFVPIEGGGHNDLDAFPAKARALADFLRPDTRP